MMKPVISDEQKIAQQLKDVHPQEIIRWGVETLGASSMTFACSFGLEDVALVDMVSKVDKTVDIFYLDTDLLFAETYEVRDRLKEKYGLDFIRISPNLTLSEQGKIFGEALWKSHPSKCCELRKVTPLRKALAPYHGWITGIRREQSVTRAHTEVVEWDEGFGLWKLNPLAYWKTEQVWNYIHEHQIPYNPLHDQNYPSIGCYPCTKPVQPGEDTRAGRWAGFSKTECGLHGGSQKNTK